MEPLLRERLDPGIEVLRLNRPERRNALNSEILELLVAALRELEVDPALRVVVLSTTSALALCAGIEVSEQLDRAGGCGGWRRSWRCMRRSRRCRCR
jgi:enoyl-CoA hydratase/carnithine racemase